MQLDEKEIREFQKEILEWYGKNKRSLPWRENRDPYRILISEVMLQQTQVSRVIPKFEEWMKAFPTVVVLAKASTRDVLLHWSGLGYNRRALYLKATAEQLLAYSLSHMAHGKKPGSPIRSGMTKRKPGMTVLWPETEKELRKLPGIGEYTARALLCFAFNKQVAVVDTNVRKVILLKFLSRHPEFISGSQSGRKKKEERRKKVEMLKQVQHDKKTIQEIADMLLPKGKAYEWNQALMDYSALVLSKEKSKTLLRPDFAKATTGKQGFGTVRKIPFKSSKRFYRGQVVRLLLKNKETIESLFGKIENNGITKEEFTGILEDMEKEGLIKKKNKTFFIS